MFPFFQKLNQRHLLFPHFSRNIVMGSLLSYVGQDFNVIPERGRVWRTNVFYMEG